MIICINITEIKPSLQIHWKAIPSILNSKRLETQI